MVNPHEGTYGEGHAERIREEVDTAFHEMWRAEHDLELALAHTGTIYDQIEQARDDPSIPEEEKLIARANAAIVCGRLATGAALMGREGEEERALTWLQDGDTALKQHKEQVGKNHQFKVHHAAHAAVAETMFGSRRKALKHLGVHATLGLVSESPRFFDRTAELGKRERVEEIVKRAVGTGLIAAVCSLRVSGQKTHAEQLALKHITL